MRLLVKTATEENRLCQSRVVGNGRLHRAGPLGGLPFLYAERAPIFIVAVRMIGFEGLLPDHAGSSHTQRPENSLLHEFLGRLLGKGLHNQLEKVVAFTSV